MCGLLLLSPDMALSRGEKISVARDAMPPNGWSQTDLAVRLAQMKALGIEESTKWRSRLANYEVGRGDVPEDALVVIARALEIPLSWFDDPLSTTPPPRTISESKANFASGFASTMAIRGWRGALAAGRIDEECTFSEDDYIEIPTAFIVGGPERAEFHDAVRVAGTSMEPRIYSGEVVVIYRDMTPRRNTIVLAQSPNGSVYLKVLRSLDGRFVLESVRDGGASEKDLSGWTIHGYAVAILGDPEQGSRNIEWHAGQALRA